MDWTHQTIEEAYKMCAKSGVLNSTIGFVSVICLIIMIARIVKIFEEQKDNENSKTLFEILKQYAKFYVFIIIFPFIVPLFESGLAIVQDKVNSELSVSVNEATEIAVLNQIENYIKEEQENEGVLSKAMDVVSPLHYIRVWLYAQTMSAYLISLAILKYLYFFFVGTRYLWLMMLQMLAPIALVCGLWEKTESITLAFFKNLTICYMLIPFYFLAHLLAEALIYVVLQGSNFNAYGIWGIVGMIVVKLAFLSYATKKAFKIIS